MDTRKHKGLKRVLVCVLTLTMAFSCMDWSFLAVYAAEDDQPVQQTEQLGQEPEQVPAQEQEDPVKAEPSAGDTEQAEQDQLPAEPEAPAQAEPQEEGPAFPAFEQTATEDGVKITVTAEEGVFPEGAALKVRAATKAEKKEAGKLVDEARDAERSVAASYTFDISVVDADGNELQPADGQKVNVAFKTAEVADKKLATEVYHIDSVAEKAEALDVSESGRTASVAVDGFSIYVVEFADDGTTVTDPRIVTYNFYETAADKDAGTVFHTQKVKQGDTLYMPSTPDVHKNHHFKGWYINGDDSTDANHLFADGDHMTVSTLPAEDVVSVIAVNVRNYYATFYDADGETIVTRKLIEDGSVTIGGEGGVTVHTANAHSKFIGWKFKGAQDSEMITDDTVTGLEGDAEFEPVFSTGIWLNFNKHCNDANIHFMPALFVPTGSTAQEALEAEERSVPDPKRNGYSFGYWSTDPDSAEVIASGESESHADAFNWNSSNLGNENITLYARYTNGTANYSVVVWKQKVDGTGYDYYDYSSVIGMDAIEAATTGSTVSLPANDVRLNLITDTRTKDEFKGFYLEGYDTSIEVAGDNSSIINIYYNRQTVTFYFLQTNSSVTTGSGYKSRFDSASGRTAYSVTGLYGAPLPGGWPSYGVSGGVGQTSGSGNAYEWNYLRESSNNINSGTSVLIPTSDAHNYATANGKDPVKYFDTYYVATSQYGSSAFPILMYLEGAGPVGNNYPVRTVDGMSFGLSGGIITNGTGSVRVANKFYGYHPYKARVGDSGTWTSYSVGQTISNSHKYTMEILYAKNESHIVFVDSMDLSVTASPKQTHKYLDDISSINTLTPQISHDGYEFAGWFIDEECNLPYTADKMPGQDLELFAGWKLKHHYVQVNLSDGELAGTLVENSALAAAREIDGLHTFHLAGLENINEEVFTSGVVPPAGYKLAGWQNANGKIWNFGDPVTDEDCDKIVAVPEDKQEDYGATQLKSMTLKPIWHLIGAIHIEYNAGAGTLTHADNNVYQFDEDAKAVVYGVAEAPSGQRFVGWRDNHGNTYETGDLISLTHDIIVIGNDGNGTVKLTAVYEGSNPTVKITYNANYDGADPATKTSADHELNDVVTLEGEECFVRSGYTLDGWATSADGDTVYDFGQKVGIDEINAETANVLYAHWIPHVHNNWTYTADGGTITASCGAPGHVGDPLKLTLTAPTNKTYTGSAIEVTSTVDTDFPVPDGDTTDVTYTTKAGAPVTGAPTEVGDYVASVTIDGKTASVEFSITKADAAVKTPPAAKAGLTYNGTDQALVVAGAAEGGTVKYFLSATQLNEPPAKTDSDWTDSLDAIKAKDAGTYYVYYYVEGDSNHNDTAVAAEPVTVTIAKKPITVTVADKTSAYKAELATLSYTVPQGDLAPGDDKDSIKIDLTTRADKNAKAGTTFEITGTVNKEDSNPNYEVTVTPGTYTITKAEAVVTVTGFSGEYDGALHGLTATVEDPRTNPFTDLINEAFGTGKEATVYYGTQELNETNYKTAGKTEIEEGSTAYKDVTNGEKTIYYYVDLTNYTADGEHDGVSGFKTVNILPKTMTESKLEDDQKPSGPNAGNTLTYNGEEQGLVTPPSEQIDGYTVKYRLKAKEGEDPAEWATTPPTGKDAATYEVEVLYEGNDDNHASFSGADIVVTIEPKEVGLEWSDLELTYNGSAQKPSATATDLIGEDTCTVTVDGEQTNAGENYTATATALSNSNYKLPTNVTTSFKIVAKTADKNDLTGAQKATAKAGLTYSGDPQALVTAPAEYPEGYSGVKYSVDGGNTWTDTVPTGTDAGNYTVQVKYVPANDNYAEFEADRIDVSISPKTLTVAWHADPEYTGSAIVYGADVRGIVAADAEAEGVTITYSGNTETNVGEYHAGISIGGARSSNYQIAADDRSHDWNITPAAATAKAPAAKDELTYNGNSQELISAGSTLALQGGNMLSTGTMKYFLSETKLNEAPAKTAEGWTEDATAIKKTNAVTYYVYYYVKGNDNHSDTDVLGPVEATIAPKDISDEDEIKAAAADSTYTGSPLTPDVTVTFDNGIFSPKITLEKETDFTVTVPEGSGTKAEQGIQLTVNGEGNYTGSRTVIWNINKADAQEPTGENALPQAATDLTYNREAQSLVKTGTGAEDLPDGTFLYKILTKDGEEVPGAQWSATKPFATDAGEYVVAYYIKGDDNHNDIGSESAPKGSFTATISPKELTEDDVTFVKKTFVYEKGKEQGPTITVKDAGIDLTLDKDYTLTDAKKIDVGTYTAKVTGTGNYTGEVTKQYEITKASSDMEAFDENQRPTPNKLDGGKNLVYDKTAQNLVTAPAAAQLPEGYTGVKYSLDGETWGELNALPTGTDADTYSVYYKYVGDANHDDVTCDAPLTVTIDPKPVTVTPTETSKTYGAKDPAEWTYTLDGVVGNDTVNVTLGREPGETVGDYAFRITGCNNDNYAPKLADGAKFTITKKDLTDEDSVSVELTPNEFTYTGNACEPAVKVTIGSGDSAVELTGDDFEASYRNNTDAAAADAAADKAPAVNVTFKGNYSGSKTETFTIEKADAAVTAPETASGLKYTGEAQSLIIKAGDATGVDGKDLTLKYFLSETASKPQKDAEGWVSDADQITKTKAGTYYIYFFTEGDKNHNASAVAGPVEVTIGQMDAPDLASLTAAQKPSAATDLVYNDTDQDLAVNPKEADMPEGYDTVEYLQNDGQTWSADIPKGKNAGSYPVQFRLADSTGDHATTAAGELNATIAKLSINDAKVTADPSSFVYDSNEKEPSVEATVTVKVNGADKDITVPAADYNVSYANNINAAEATAENAPSVTVKAKTDSTNFTGAASGKFAITAKTIEANDIEVSFPSGKDAPVYNGNPQKPKPVVKVPDPANPDKTITLGEEDYEVVYPEDTTNEGEKTAKIVLKGNYSGEKDNQKYTIKKRPLTVNIEDQEVTFGTAIDQTKYSISEDTPAVDGQEVTVVLNQSQTGATNGTPGKITATVTVKAGEADVTDNYDITAEAAKLTINRASLDPSALTDDQKPSQVAGGRTYNTKAQELVTPPAAATVPKGYKLQYKLSTDSADKWSDSVPQGKDAGNYTVQYKYVPTDENHSEVTDESFTLDVTIAQADLSGEGVVIAVDPDSFEFDGKDKEPAVTVTLNGVTLPESDYDVSFKDNQAAGTATVTVTGKKTGNEFSGNCINSKSTTFSIEAKPLKPEDVTVFFPTGDDAPVYNGESQKPEPEVVVGGRTLTKGEDYDLIYPEDTTNAGDKEVKIVFKGDYANSSDTETGEPVEITGTYNIAKKPVTITAKDQVISHDGAIEQGVDQVSAGELVAGHALTEITLEQSVTADPGSNDGKFGEIEAKSAKIEDTAGADLTKNYAFTYEDGKLTIKAAQNAPTDEDLKDLIDQQTTTSITINTQPGYEYFLSTDPNAPADDADWSALTGDEVKGYYKEEGSVAGTHTFSGLEKGTVYYVHVRKAATDPVEDDPATPEDESDPGKDPSPSVTVPTSTRPEAPASAKDGYDVDYAKETLTAKEGFEIFDKNAGENGEGAWVTQVKDFVPGEEYAVRVAATDDGVAPSDYVKFIAPERPDAPEAVGDTDQTDTTITIKDSEKEQEYLLLPAKEGGYTPEELEKLFKENKGTAGTGDDLTLDKDSNGNVLEPGRDYVVYNRTKAVTEPADQAALASEIAGPAETYTTLPAPEAGEGYSLDYPQELIEVEEGYEIRATSPEGTEPEQFTQGVKGEDGKYYVPLTPGATYEVRKAEVKDDDGNVTAHESEPASFTTTPRPDTPDPVKKDDIQLHDDSLTIDPTVKGQEYIVVPKGATEEEIEQAWKDAQESKNGEALTFDGLQENTEYVVMTRVKATEEAPHSNPASTEITTPLDKLSDDSISTTPTTLTIKDPQPNTQYEVTTKDENGEDEVVATITVDENGNITVEPEGKAEKDADGNIVVSGLDPEKEYSVTQAKTDEEGNPVTVPSEPTTVKTPKLIPEETPNTPNVVPESDTTIAINDPEKGTKYDITTKDEDGNDVPVATVEYDEDGNVTVTPSDSGITAEEKDGKIVVRGLEPNTEYEITATKTPSSPDNTNSEASKPIKVQTPKSVPDADKVKQDKLVSEAGSDGSIKGVDDTMEYSTDGGKTWTPVPDGADEITGLDTGKVLVRYEGNEETGQPASDSIEVDVKAKDNQEAPGEGPAVKEKTDTSVTIDPTEAGQEYIIVKKGEEPDWSNPTKSENGEPITFDGLDPGADYEVLTRKPGYDQNNPSPAAKTEVTTEKSDQEAPGEGPVVKEKTDSSVTIDPTEAGQEYIIVKKGEEPDWSNPTKSENGEPITFDGLDPAADYEVLTRKPGDDQHNPSPATKTEVTTEKADQAVPSDEPVVKAGATSITVDPSDEAQEYIVVPKGTNPEDYNWDDAKPGNGGALVFDGLEEGKDYEVVTRMRGTETQNPSDPVVSDPVTTGKGNQEAPSEGPAVKEKTDTSVTIDPTVPGQEYIIVKKGEDPDWSNPTKSENGEAITFDGLEPGADYEVLTRKPGDSENNPSPAAKTEVTTEKSDQAAPESAPSVKATSPTTIVVDPASPDEEYSIDGGKTWVKPKEGETTVVFDNLKPGTDYEVISRKVGTDQANPSPASPAAKVSTPRAEPSGLLLGKVTPKGSRSLNITWTKVENVDGYDIFLAKCNHSGKEYKYKKVKTINGNEKFSFTKKLLKKNTSYKVYVKAFVKNGGKKTYVSTSLHMHCHTGNGGIASNVKAVKVAKNKFTLKVGKTKKVKAKIIKVNKNKPLMSKLHAPQLRYLSSNTKVATVTKAGVVKAKAKGKCYIYAVGVNGARAKVKVTVK